jgi:uncharacterized protein YoxC
MLWIKLALLGVVLAVLTGGVVKVTSFLAEKDRQIEQREQTIVELNAKVAGLRTDLERVQASNATLEQDLRRKIEEAAKARQEAAVLRASDTQAVLRQRDLELKLNDRERIDRIERVSHSRGAERVVQVVNRSAKCEIENFFQTDGQCRSGVWVPNAAKAPAEGASNAAR